MKTVTEKDVLVAMFRTALPNIVVITLVGFSVGLGLIDKYYLVDKPALFGIDLLTYTGVCFLFGDWFRYCYNHTKKTLEERFDLDLVNGVLRRTKYGQKPRNKYYKNNNDDVMFIFVILGLWVFVIIHFFIWIFL